ncbi:hypothetical protein BGX21_003732 [Mortierella sp. AD011]|nr:hypothetical protein BGX20_003573 [Mortierella sp. AD010]KAF9375633.1 hypothetical protein BGX21_003732 [Mortierella sp. AD011]
MNQEYIQWADANGDREHVSISSFAKKFRYFDRDTAEEDFLALIQNPRISVARHERLLKNFRTFNANRAGGFWAKRASISNADIIAMKAADDSMEVGYQQAKIINQQRFQEEREDESDLPPKSTRDKSQEAPQFVDDNKVTTTSTAAPIFKAIVQWLHDAKKRLEEEKEAGQGKRRRVSFGSTVSTTTTTSTSTSGSLYLYHGSVTSSESNLYVYNFLAGGGREDSGLETPWTHNGIDISKDLMTFRDRVVQENYGISQPHEMLVVNFIFLLESENQTWGVQGEVQDHVWGSMWDCVGKIKINNFESTTIVECHKWAGLTASNGFDEFSKLLRNEPPSFPLLHQVLLQLTLSQQLWTFSGRENEATFIRYLIDPCLNATFGSIKHTSSKWTTVLDETRGQDSRLLFPDFSLVTQLRSHSCSLIHMEGKTAANKGWSQIWDDLTKLGQELKHSLDTMIVQEPSGPVSVIGILLTGYNLEFYEMTIQSEGVYIFKKYADCYLFNKAENMFPLCRLLEILETTKVRGSKFSQL